MWTKQEICSFVDLTSLNAYDSVKSINQFLEQALIYSKSDFKVAAVCLFPNFASLAVEKLKNTDIKTAVVAGVFPHSQSFLSTRLNECELALESGVDELDIVINLGALIEKDYDTVLDEIKAVKNLMGSKTLKVILETGFLKEEAMIRKASELALAGGADFLKTSTGKEFSGADKKAVKTMCEVLADHHTIKGEKRGLKISGGIRTYEDAFSYLALTESILGKEFIIPDLFRIGASSLVKNLMDD
ncbi:MAG: deoxyribose-phosphate aldolase [Brumimicrobium sp.]|nr:deoxyribose-phosphate aldolase [Brumimicrobium sp.]